MWEVSFFWGGGKKKAVCCSSSEPSMGALKYYMLRSHICTLYVVPLTCRCAMSNLLCAFLSGATCALGI